MNLQANVTDLLLITSLLLNVRSHNVTGEVDWIIEDDEIKATSKSDFIDTDTCGKMLVVTSNVKDDTRILFYTTQRFVMSGHRFLYARPLTIYVNLYCFNLL